MSLPTARCLRITAILALLALSLLPSLAHATETTPPVCSGTYYTVRPGDTWSIVSWRTGITVAELKRLNPSAIRPNNWLWIGDHLCIPTSQEAANGYWHQVQPGDTWNAVARATGVAVRDLWRANPGLVNRLYWLYIGQRVWIPTGQPSAPPSSTPAAVKTTPTPTPVPLPSPTPVGCAASLAGYPDLILTYLNTPGNTVPALKTWLAKCSAITEDPEAVVTAAIQSDMNTDLIIALHDPLQPPPEGAGTLLVYHSSTAGYKLAHQAASTGSAALLTTADLNADKRPEIVWADTTCSAHTCFTALHVDAWDGTAYLDWIEGEPTLASAEFKFADVAPEGSGQEIVAHGGVIGSVGAGPQRAWTATYISPNGEPYTLFTQTYDPSPCLYHKILDANAAFDQWGADGFEAAITAYIEAIDDQTLEACGNIADELATLRDFARFRLTIAQFGGGQPADARATLTQITHAALRGAVEAFYNAYMASGSIIQACRDTTTYAQANPGTWQFLADWGYANPSFTAEELCPLK